MPKFFPAGTTTIRNLTPRFSYFLVVKPDALVDDIPQKEYFVYRFKVPVSDKDGIKNLKNYFSDVTLETCKALGDVEYSTGTFSHPAYLNQNRKALTFQLKEIPIYFQSTVGVIDLEKDPYQYGSKPIIKDKTNSILESSVIQRKNGNLLIEE
jgi:hypothetical protein